MLWTTPESLTEKQPFLDRTGKFAITADARAAIARDRIVDAAYTGSARTAAAAWSQPYCSASSHMNRASALVSIGISPSSGLPVTRIRIQGYVLCGYFAALAALCITGATASGDPRVGAAMTLNSVAAVVIGVIVNAYGIWAIYNLNFVSY